MLRVNWQEVRGDNLKLKFQEELHYPERTKGSSKPERLFKKSGEAFGSDDLIYELDYRLYNYHSENNTIIAIAHWNKNYLQSDDYIAGLLMANNIVILFEWQEQQNRLPQADVFILGRDKERRRAENWSDLDIKNFTPSIQELHRECYLFLYERYKEDTLFTFSVRPHQQHTALRKGWCLLGDNKSCRISFWTGKNKETKTPNIYWERSTDSTTKLVLSVEKDTEEALFIRNIATLLKLYKINSTSNSYESWEKVYYTEWREHHLVALKEFIDKDKLIIDAQIYKAQRQNDNIIGIMDFISTETFQRNISDIIDYLPKEGNANVNENQQEQQGTPIRLIKVDLNSIVLFEKLTIDLRERIVCVLGDNGTGKTTVLRAIALGLVGMDSSSEMQQDRKQYKELQHLLHIKGLNDDGNIQYAERGKISLSYKRDYEYENTIFLEQKHNTLDVVLRDDLSSNGFNALQDYNYFPNLVIGFTQGDHGHHYKFGTYEQQRANIGDLTDLLFNSRQEYFSQLKEWIFDLDGDKSLLNNNKEIIDFIFDVVSGLIGQTIKIKSIEHQRKEIWVTIGENDPILFSLISQGFTKVFTWIGHFIKRLVQTNPDNENFKDAPAIVLIDEIDTYLHPKWQRNILAFLAETFTNTQFIVTTHSPLVANYINGEEIEGGIALYRLDKGAAQPKEFKKNYGRDLTSIFHDWMGIADRPKEVTHLIDNLFKNIDKETKDSLEEAKQQILQLKQWLEPTDEIIIEAETYYNLALESIEE